MSKPDRDEITPMGESDFDHSVTYANTRKHWVLYTLDSLESDHEPEDDEEGEVNTARSRGVYPESIYEYAAGDDSIVFKSANEVAAVLGEMAREGTPWEDGSRAVNRRTETTNWDEADVKYRYRLNDYGRKVLLDLGVPDKLPNRQDLTEDDRALGVKPAHQPGWWLPEYDLFSSEWDHRDHDWLETEHERVFWKEDGDKGLGGDRGYLSIGTKLADRFPDVTFVLTVGPNRMHDLMYAIRDPFNKVVQIDVYSPMAMHRTREQIATNFEALVKDLDKGLASVTGEYVDGE